VKDSSFFSLDCLIQVFNWIYLSA